MTQRNRREDEDKARENLRSFDPIASPENGSVDAGHETNGKYERGSVSGSLLSNRYRDNDLYERQNA